MMGLCKRGNYDDCVKQFAPPIPDTAPSDTSIEGRIL